MLVRFGHLERSKSGRLLVGFTLLLAVVFGGVAWAEHHWQVGRLALERRSYAEAREHLNCYLRLWPRSAAAHLMLARCARGQASYAEAERLLERAWQLGGDEPAIVLEQYLVDAQRGSLKPDEARLLWQRLEKGHPESVRILEALALGNLYSYRLGEALACAERWLELAPEDSQAWHVRGLIRQGLGSLPQAGDDYRRAVALDPQNDAACQSLAEYLSYAGESAAAAEWFARLLERQPDRPALLLGMAHCRRLQGRTEEARQLLDQLLDREDVPSTAYVERALIARTEAKLSAAEQWYRQALERDPSDLTACRGLASCLHALGRSSEAESYDKRAEEIDGDLERLRLLHTKMGQTPDDPELPYEAGLICLRNGQKAEARRWFWNVLQSSPQHAGARRGWKEAAER